MSADGQALDWRDAQAYAPLLGADRSILAWEWLRRDPGYRTAARAARAAKRADPARLRYSADAACWGLLAFEHPDLEVPHARPMWSAARHQLVLPAAAAAATQANDAFHFERFARHSTLIKGADAREHLLLSDGARAIRVDIAAGSLTAGPVELRYLLGGFASVERSLLTLRRLLALWRTGRFSACLHPRESRARRWVVLLRVLDGLTAGADQRELASVLLSQAVLEPRWRTTVSSVRSQAQRLVRQARRMAAGGYLELLG